MIKGVSSLCKLIAAGLLLLVFCTWLVGCDAEVVRKNKAPKSTVEALEEHSIGYALSVWKVRVDKHVYIVFKEDHGGLFVIHDPKCGCPEGLNGEFYRKKFELNG